MDVSKNINHSCVILDDDPLSVHILEHHLSFIDEMKLAASFTDPIDAMAYFTGVDFIDYLFLDINMTVSGIDVARMIRNKVRFIIYVTGYSDFALEAFEHGDAFLVKPVDSEVLLRAINHLTAKRARLKPF